MSIMYSNNDTKKVSPEEHIIEPLFPGTKPTYKSNTNRFFGRKFGIPMEHRVSRSYFERGLTKSELTKLYSITIQTVS